MQYDIGLDDRMFPVTKSYLYREMQRGCQETGVKRIRIHDLRHSHNQMAWVGRMNNIRNRAMEMVNSELIYRV